MKFITMEVNLPPRLLPCPQDTPGGVRIKDPLLVEDVNIVDSEASILTVALQSRNLLADHILSSCFCCTASTGGKRNIARQRNQATSGSDVMMNM